MTPAQLFAVTWAGCLPDREAERLCPAAPNSSVDAERARELAGRWLSGTWADLWWDLSPTSDPERDADRACWQILTRYGDQVHGPAAYDAVRDIATRALARTAFPAAAAIAPRAARMLGPAAYARALLGAVGPSLDPWRPSDWATYEERYGHLLGIAWAHLASTVEAGQRAADRLRRSLQGDAVEV